MKSIVFAGLTKKSQKVNFTLLTEPADRIFLGNTDFLVSPNMDNPRRNRGCVSKW
jgi:hypothetical protein